MHSFKQGLEHAMACEIFFHRLIHPITLLTRQMPQLASEFDVTNILYGYFVSALLCRQRLALEQADLELAKQLQEEELLKLKSSAAGTSTPDINPLLLPDEPTHAISSMSPSAEAIPPQSTSPQQSQGSAAGAGQKETNSTLPSTGSSASLSWVSHTILPPF